MKPNKISTAFRKEKITMAELLPKERLQPSLLDRLSDDKPHVKVESRDDRVLSFQRLKQSVMRDIEWLLNTISLDSFMDLKEYDNAVNSVLNFGLPDFTGKTASTLDVHALERALRQRILTFEPRILPRSLKVCVEEKNNYNTVTIVIEGELWSQPLPEHLYLKTILDLELGDFKFTKQG